MGSRGESVVNEDFRDLLSAFVRADVRFLVVGGYAVGIHGRPRATKDLDLWIESSALNARRVICTVVGLDDLLSNKRAAGRPQDLADVDALERLREARRRDAGGGKRAKTKKRPR